MAVRRPDVVIEILGGAVSLYLPELGERLLNFGELRLAEVAIGFRLHVGRTPPALPRDALEIVGLRSNEPRSALEVPAQEGIDTGQAAIAPYRLTMAPDQSPGREGKRHGARTARCRTLARDVIERTQHGHFFGLSGGWHAQIGA